MKKSGTYSFEITGLNPGGKGLAFLDDVETTIGHAIPGQVVEARVVKKKRQKAQARIKSVIQHRPDEVAAFCPHFGQPPTESNTGCGGCQWQQLPYAVQLHLKQNLIQDLLAPLLPRQTIQPIVPSPLESQYRNKVEFSFGDKGFISDERYLALREAKEPMPISFNLGFHTPGSFGTVLDIQACYLISPALRKVYQALHQLIPTLGFPVYSTKSQTGFWRHLILREGFRTGDIMVHLNTTDSHSPDWQPILDVLNALELPNHQIRSVLHSVHTGEAQIVGWNPPTVLQGEALIEEELCDLRFEISPYAFFQTNTLAAEQLYGVIARMADLSQAPVIYDLYSGTGTIGMILAQAGAAQVFGLEEIESAVADARYNADRNGIENCTFQAGKVEALLADLLHGHPPDMAVLDPPRAGLHPKVIKMLLAQQIPQLLYVSCNPAALVRDLESLLEIYQVSEVQPVDMFPQTGHVETVLKLVLKSK